MYEELLAETKREFPDFSIVRKEDSRLMRVINVLLRIITFGLLNRFMTHFTTTIGYTIYTPTTWEESSEKTKAVTIRHERVHMRQRRQYGWMYNVLYLLIPLPAGLAYYRFKFEREAYWENLRAIMDAGGKLALYNPEQRERFISLFTSAQYCWTWVIRKDVERWYDEAVDDLVAREP